jgi:hypothetical protein
MSVWHSEYDEEEVFEAPYVVTLCDNKDLPGQDTLTFVPGFFAPAGAVFWTTTYDIDEYYNLLDGGSVNITTPQVNITTPQVNITTPQVNITTPQVKPKKNKDKKQGKNKESKEMNKKKDGKKMLRG